MNNIVTTLKKWLPLVALVVAVVAHVLHFDHWGATAARLAGWVPAVLAATGITWYGLGSWSVALVAGFLLYRLICQAPRRLYYLYAAMLLAAQLWCGLNTEVTLNRLLQAATATDFTATLATALTVAGFTGVAYLVFAECVSSRLDDDFFAHILAGVCTFVYFGLIPLLVQERGTAKDGGIASGAIGVVALLITQSISFYNYRQEQKLVRMVRGSCDCGTASACNCGTVTDAKHR